MQHEPHQSLLVVGHGGPLLFNFFYYFNSAKVQYLQPCFLPTKGQKIKNKSKNQLMQLKTNQCSTETRKANMKLESASI